MAKKTLLDLLVQQHPNQRRDTLYARIICGDVRVGGERCKNPKENIDTQHPITIEENHAYVSRGGEKLAHALEEWKVPVANKVWIDAGASTGGFTDALLRKGATLVYSVDVGYNQLDYRLREDSRVVVMERTNAMHLGALDPQPDGVVADLSFRSLRGVAKHLLTLTKDRCGIFLLKPQFEIEQTESFTGVITDNNLIQEVCTKTIANLEEEGVHTAKVLESPIQGRKGNREFLLSLYI